MSTSSVYSTHHGGLSYDIGHVRCPTLCSQKRLPLGSCPLTLNTCASICLVVSDYICRTTWNNIVKLHVTILFVSWYIYMWLIWQPYTYTSTVEYLIYKSWIIDRLLISLHLYCECCCCWHYWYCECWCCWRYWYCECWCCWRYWYCKCWCCWRYWHCECWCCWRYCYCQCWCCWRYSMVLRVLVFCVSRRIFLFYKKMYLSTTTNIHSFR